jgi:hypothetical protein
MRIICDHCGSPISGTVKRVPGNFTLHPDCLAQLGKEPKDESTAVLCPEARVFSQHVARVEGNRTGRFWSSLSRREASAS